MTTRYEVAIRRPGDRRVMVLRDRTLPGFASSAPPPWQVVTIVGDEVRSRYGLDVVTLRAASVDEPGTDRPDGRRLYEADLVGGAPPAGATWVDDGDLDPDLAALVRPAIGDRQPWYRTGWLAEMSAWIDGLLADAGIGRHGPIRQVRTWGRAALLTMDTDRGRLWAKAVPDVFSHEVAVTELLADIDPGIVPPVVAADRALGRIVTEHVDGPSLASVGDEPAVWMAAMSRLAEIQRILASERGALAVAGVAEAPLGHLAASLPGLMGDDDLLLLDRDGGLSATEGARLRARLPELVDACRALAAGGLPDSLEHGDLAADEVIIGEMGPVFLDWSDGSITHPFLSAASLLLDGAPSGREADDRVPAYLGPWLGAGLGLTQDAGRDALALARIVLPLHLASLYAERILPDLEQPWELERIIPRVLRTILPE